jgi:hypothetical protein
VSRFSSMSHGCLLVALSVAFDAAPAFAQEAEATKVLFIGKEPDHPYGSHMYMHTCGVLAKCAELSPGVEAVVSNGWPEDAARLRA